MSQQVRGGARSAEIGSCDPVWSQIRKEAEAIVDAEPALSGFIHDTILGHSRLEPSLSVRLAQLLDSGDVNALVLREVFDEAYSDEPVLSEAVRADLGAVQDRDPACSRFIEPVLYFKGFQALQTQRVGHWLWNQGRRDFALYLQSRASKVFGVDIHPAARMGRGIFMDHATGIVIGETAVVDDDVSMLHGVTLGGTGKAGGDRHPKIRQGVLLGAGATVLGNIEIGHCARVAAGSVVLKPVPPCKTVAGVPAKIVGEAGCAKPARSMEHRLAEAAAGDPSAV